MIILIIHIIVTYDQNISLIFLCERWIPCQALTSVLCLHYRPETVHCSTKDLYNSEITFLALHSWFLVIDLLSCLVRVFFFGWLLYTLVRFFSRATMGRIYLSTLLWYRLIHSVTMGCSTDDYTDCSYTLPG